MAIIRCTAREDGTLVPYTIEFERGDRIRLEENEPARAINVQSSFTLGNILFSEERLMLDRDASGRFVITPDPRLPPPPPEQGGFITIIVDRQTVRSVPAI